MALHAFVCEPGCESRAVGLCLQRFQNSLTAPDCQRIQNVGGEMKKGVVLFLDILGFKGIWQRADPERVLKTMQDIGDWVNSAYLPIPENKGWPRIKEPTVSVLSDTIVITMECDSPGSLFYVPVILNPMFVNLMKESFFIRGAIAYGDYMHSGNTFVGPAIDDVAAWYEHGDWIGILTTPTTSYAIDSMEINDYEKNGLMLRSYIKQKIPVKSGDGYELNCYNWPGFMEASTAEPVKADLSNTRSFLIRQFSQQTGVTSSVLRKYENTVAFVDSCMKNGVKFKQD